MAKPALLIERSTVPEAWAAAFLALMEPQIAELRPLVIRVTSGTLSDLVDDSSPIQRLLDMALRRQGKKSVATAANSLFPYSMWHRQYLPAASLFERYHKLLPRIKKRAGNRYGIYFERLTRYPLLESSAATTPAQHVNQLAHILDTWRRGNRRRSALQASVFHPARDHTHQRRRGFPCLQQVAFYPLDSERLGVAGVYTHQYVFDRAFGNYLGLCRLGEFMAHEMGLRLEELQCTATVASLGEITKAQLEPLTRELYALGLSKPL